MRLLFLALCLLPALAALAPAAPVADAPGSPAGNDFFEKKIRPVLVENCYPCHSTAANKRRGGLLLDTRDGFRKGGDSGPALVPGKPDESLFLKAVRHTGDLKMPPKGKLPAPVVADLEAWVKMGAPDPRDKATAAVTASWEEVLARRRQWWSLQPVRLPVIPAVRDAAWSRSPVDRFLLARLEQAGLQPAAPADRRTLIRRLSLVLLGLPPAPEETEAFVQDDSPAAWERLVDRLLASPHFGERWARHWLDVVRFSETHGNEWNYEVHHAWRYRDYLIRAFNDDVPYDQLVCEHVAGDLLPRPRWNTREQFNESVIGTAFYRFGEANHDDCITLRQIGFDLVDNQLDTLTKAFQATTVACARCHDHKLDAISTKDYHGLLGILRSSRLVSHTIDAPEVNAEPLRRLTTLKAEVRRELGAAWLHEAGDVGRFLTAAQAKLAGQPDAAELAKGLDLERLGRWVGVLKTDKAPLEEPFSPWRLLASGKTDWRQLAERVQQEERERTGFNAARFRTVADFRAGTAGWQVGGQGLRQGPAHAGDFVLGHEGDVLVRAVLPGGCFTHALSDRLNGTLRSPVLPAGGKRLSFQVMGRHGAAVRLVSNNCQLNYKNYRGLTSAELQWLTFTIPEDTDSLRVYAELMTMLDNPKFPDQLSALGGDPDNYRVPWDKATADPRSFFGVTRVVLHDGDELPRPELGHLRALFAAPEPATRADVAARYTETVAAAVRAWTADQASDEDVVWLQALLRGGLLGNSLRLTPRLQELAAEYRRVEQGLAQPRVVPGVADFGPGFAQPILVRGDCWRPGAAVARRYLEVLARPEERPITTGSGRLELAEQIASRDNPLTARVMVNRVWHHLFGAGLVRTPDDFGHVGELPSHPELLDYLAARFMDEGWSVKRLIRSLVLTEAFRTASRPSPRAQEVDPQNRLLQHYPARRLEAEGIRDAILAASGRLDGRLFGPSVQPYREQENADRRLFPGPLDGAGRRSVYVKNNLMEGPKFLGAFDFPGGKVTQGRRDVTNVPAQALALLNDPFVLQQAELWAGRLVRRPDATVAARIVYVFRAGLGRPPEAEERQRFEQAVGELAALEGVPAEDVLRSRAVWKDIAHAVFNLKEFIYIP
jgi:hypothetical protein